MTLGKPTETYAEDLYTFHWPNDGVTAVIERFQESKDDVRAELTINSDHPTKGGQLYFGRLLLMGPRARAEVRNALEKRDTDPDWGGMLEQVCTLALRRYRQGAPPVDLWHDNLGEPPRYLLKPFVFDDAVNLVYGMGDSGKSVFCLALALCVATGQEVGGLIPEKRGPVLYLDWEDSAATHQERLKGLALAAGIKVEPKQIIYRRMDASLKESIREVRRDVGGMSAVLVVIDSIGMACGGDPNSAEAVIQTMLAARSLGVPAIAIHHLAKMTKNENKSTPYGSVYASNEARNSYLVESEREAGRLEMVLTNYKANRGERAERQSFRLVFTEDERERIERIEFTPTGFRDSRTVGHGGHKWKIAEAVKAGALPIGQTDTAEQSIAFITQIAASTIRTTFTRNPEMFQKQGDTLPQAWGLTDALHVAQDARYTAESVAPRAALHATPLIGPGRSVARKEKDTDPDPDQIQRPPFMGGPDGEGEQKQKEEIPW